MPIRARGVAEAWGSLMGAIALMLLGG